MRAMFRRIVGGVLLVLAGACSSPPTRFYTLDSTAALGTAATAAARLTVSVGPVLIPALVDRPQMVFDAGANQVSVEEFNRWAAPLADQITRVTVDNLSRLLPQAELWPSTAAAAAKADVRVSIDVQAFRSTPGKSVLLDARWTVQRGKVMRSGRAQLNEASNGPGADGLAAAHSRALARLAADIAQAIGGV